MSTAVVMESLVGIVLFTIIIVTFTLRNPLVSVGDYPPAIREKCIELGLIEKREQRFTQTDFIRKGMALIVFVIAFAFVLKYFNGADTFRYGLPVDWMLCL